MAQRDEKVGYKHILAENTYICGTNDGIKAVRPCAMSTSIRMPKSTLLLLSYILVLPGFFIATAFLYNPFDIQGYYTFRQYTPQFHIVLLTCIQLVILTATRVPLHFAIRGRIIKRWQYGCLVVGEIFLAACFMALYTELFKHNPGGWFQSLADCMKFSFLVLCYPALFFYMLQIILTKDKEIEDASAPRSDDSLVKFYDEHKRLKLTIAPSSILYVESQANYVMIHYLDAGKPKEFQLRCSMKSIESSVEQHGLVRCHRSFFVNPVHVRVLRKETDGLTHAELDASGVPSVPVSKQYYDSLSSLF